MASLSSTADDEVAPDKFPVGLRVLVVDDDCASLNFIDKMLRSCFYHVITCSRAETALEYLRERKGSIDLVLSDVYMPDMDGYKLLELVGLEMDLPVIMMSADGGTDAVMRGIKHGACDYLIKPIRREELKNIWQHVFRKKWHVVKELEHFGGLEDNCLHIQGNDDDDSEGTDMVSKGEKKRSNAKEEHDAERETEDHPASKKPRVVWSVELHQQFVKAFNQLGSDKAVPKRILELMNVPGLTRENVASHLQKFRLYLKRLSEVPQHGRMSNAYSVHMDSNAKCNELERLDIQGLAESGQIPPQTLAVLRTELLDQPAGGLDNATNQPPPMLPWQHFDNNGTTTFCSNAVDMSSEDSDLFMDMLHHKQQQQPQLLQWQRQSTFSEPSQSVNVQQSCLIPPHAVGHCHTENALGLDSQSSHFNGNSVVESGLLSLHSNNSLLDIEQILHDLKPTDGSVVEKRSSQVWACSENEDNIVALQVLKPNMIFLDTIQLPGAVPSICEFQNAYGSEQSDVLDQAPNTHLGVMGKATGTPSQFILDEEPHAEFVGDGRVSLPILQQFPAEDIMSVFAE